MPFANAELNFAPGIGSQYGVVAGVKIIKQSDKTNFYGIIGLGSIGLGFERPISDSGNTTFGLSTVKGFDMIVEEYDVISGNISYHASGYQQPGFMIGLDLGYISAEGFLGLDEADDESAYVGLSLGYRF